MLYSFFHSQWRDRLGIVMVKCLCVFNSFPAQKTFDRKKFQTDDRDIYLILTYFHEKQTQIHQNNENLLMKTCSYGVIVSMICDIQSMAEFVAVMRGKILKQIDAQGSQNLAVVPLQGGHIKGVFIQEIKCDFARPKEVAVITGWPH